MRKNYTLRFTVLVTLFIATAIFWSVVCSSAIANSVNNNPALLFEPTVNK